MLKRSNALYLKKKISKLSNLTSFSNSTYRTQRFLFFYSIFFFFTESALWADLVYNPTCPFVCLCHRGKPSPGGKTESFACMTTVKNLGTFWRQVQDCSTGLILQVHCHPKALGAESAVIWTFLLNPAPHGTDVCLCLSAFCPSQRSLDH